MLLAELLSGEVVREDIASQEDVAEIIEDRWGRAICDVYERAVSSPTPADCPPLLEWIDALAEFANLQETKIVEQEQTESSSSNNGLDLTVVLILASIILFIVILVLFNL
jgi:hypothetical protein